MKITTTLARALAVLILTIPCLAQKSGYSVPSSCIGMSILIGPGSISTSSGTVVASTGGKFTLSANSTTFGWVHTDGTIQTGASVTAGDIPIFKVVTGVDSCLSITDLRTDAQFVASGGGGGGLPAGCTSPGNGQITCTTFTGNVSATSVSSGTVTASSSVTTPNITGSGTGGYQLTGPGAALPSTPGPSNNGIFFGTDAVYMSFQNAAWDKVVLASSVPTAGLNAAVQQNQIDNSNTATGEGQIFPFRSDFPNCPIYLGWSTSSNTATCNGLGQNIISAATYTVLNTDLLDFDTYQGSGDSTWTLPAPTASFVQPWAFYVANQSTGSGRVLVTPTGSTIDGGAQLAVPPGNTAFIYATSATTWASSMPPNNGGVIALP